MSNIQNIPVKFTVTSTEAPGEVVNFDANLDHEKFEDVTFKFTMDSRGKKDDELVKMEFVVEIPSDHVIVVEHGNDARSFLESVANEIAEAFSQMCKERVELGKDVVPNFDEEN